MNQAIPGHSAPAVGFEVPIEMLSACHGRVQHQCDTLLRLLAHVQVNGPDRPAQEAATAVMRYFETAARHHHEDEEQDLFPALLDSMAGSDAVCLRALTTSLSSDHRQLEARWRVLREWLVDIEAGRPTRVLDEEIRAFTLAYEQHIAREETELLPMANRLLGDAELDRIGRAMRARRGLASLDPLQP
jgi:hemerythrin-like domain-containing protein